MKNKKAIYIIGGGYLGLNIINWAKELDLKTIVTDKKESAPGQSIADESLTADGTDVRKHIEFAKKMSEKYKIIGVHCGSEFGVWTVHYLSKTLGLETNSKQALENVLDKAKMKRIWSESGVVSPNAIEIQNCNELIDIIKQNPFPHVVKPTLGSGSRGVQIVNHDSDIETVFNVCNKSMNNQSPIIVEPYIDGRSIDANGIFLDGIFYPCGILEKFITPAPDCLPIGGYDPANIKDKEVADVYALLEKSCRSLGLTFGPIKGDFIRKKDGSYIVLEVAPRFHGDVTLSHTLPFGSKINPVKFYFQYLSTAEIKKSFIEPKTTKYATWRVICLPPGNFKMKLKQKSLSKINQITNIWYNEKCDTKIDCYTNTSKIPGYICAYGKNKLDAERALEQYFTYKKYDIEPNERYKEWYKLLGKQITSIGFSKESCGFKSELFRV